MSEYQYYEFWAIDKPLTAAQRQDLRKLSSRADITATRFTNTYHWGDFKGNPRQMMEKYFDAFVYLSNWGTRWLMFRLPRTLVPVEVVNQYCCSDFVSVTASEHDVIFEFLLESEDGGWIDEDEDWMSSLVQLRSDLAGGDYRCLYLAWLKSAECGAFDDEEVEPPVPPNLGRLSESLQALADFMFIDNDLIQVAAQNSAHIAEEKISPAKYERWIETLSPKDKDAWLLKLILNDHSHLGEALRQRYKQAHVSPIECCDVSRRAACKLLASAEKYTEIRLRLEAEQKAKEKARLEKALAAARKKHLLSIKGKQHNLWLEIDAFISVRQARQYDRALTLLKDLRDLSELEGTTEMFKARIQQMRTQHAAKSALMRRFRDARLY